MGAHVLAIKDMGGLCRPHAATVLVKALKEEVGLPIHFHTHDTSGIAAASVLADVVEHKRGEKKIAFKMKRRKGYHRTVGHRQELTVVKIKSINA